MQAYGNGTFWYQHLYLACSYEGNNELTHIGDGDWFINDSKNNKNKLEKAKYTTTSNTLDIREEGYYDSDHFHKILATTDHSLNLPLIPQSFIEACCAKQMKVGSVSVEIESNNDKSPSVKTIAHDYDSALDVLKSKYVIIHCVESNEPYNNQELRELLKHAFESNDYGDSTSEYRGEFDTYWEKNKHRITESSSIYTAN